MSTTMTLSDLMVAVRQRADMLPAGYSPSTSSTAYFVTDPELISYINQSYFELYDILVTAFEDWYVAAPTQFTTTGVQLYTLPDGVVSFINAQTGLSYVAPALYKLLGVDLGLTNTSNAWVTLKQFDFISRNRFVYPQLQSTVLGVFNLRYRVVGNNIMFIPTPSAGQIIQLWYVPRMTQLTGLSDTADGVSGWTEYIICDAATKCMQKEESDVSVLAAQKGALLKRIEEASQNRDAGMSQTISDTRSWAERWGMYGAPNGDGSSGGY